MKNWEQMKDLTYVNIKSMKSQSVTEGMTKCRLEKLTRNNPVYQHIQLHKQKSLPNCPVCSSPFDKKQSPLPSSRKKGTNLKLKLTKSIRSKTLQVLRTSQAESIVTNPLALQTSRHVELNKRLDKIIAETPRRPKTPREKVLQEGQRMKSVIDKFDQSVRRSKSHLTRLNKGIDKAEGYFLTTIDDIELQMNEDKGLSLKEVKEDYQRLKKDMNLHAQKMKKLADKVKQFSKPVVFPLTTQQVHNIVDSSSKVNNLQAKKLKKIITNLYEYKSSKNYSNRMKMVGQIISKQE